MLRRVAEAQLRPVISPPAGQVAVVQNGTGVAEIQADGGGRSTGSKVDVFACCLANTRGAVRRSDVVSEKAPLVFAPTDHAAVDQVSAPELCGKFNGMNARVEVSNVLPRGLLRGRCTRSELVDVVFSSTDHRPVVQGKTHEFLGDAH